MEKASTRGSRRVFMIIVLLTHSIICLSQPWSDLLNPTSSETLPKYRILMEDINVSWYEVEEEYTKYWANQKRSPSEGEGGSEFQRYLEFMKNNSDENGFYKPSAKNIKFWDKIRATRATRRKAISSANWQPIGPDVVHGNDDLNNSRMHSIYQDPSNHDLLWAGGGTAGVWKSLDGGNSWDCISNSMEKATNIDAVVPDRNNHDHVIIASRKDGLFRTTDDGINWTKATEFSTAYKIFQHPSTATVWYAGANDGFYESIDNGATWTLLYAANKVHDFEMHPTDTLIIYILEEIVDANDENQRIYKSTDGGSTFNILTNGLPADADGDFPRAEIAVTPDAPDNVYAIYSDAVHNGFYGLYISTDAGENFTFQCCDGSPGGPYSSTNPNILGYSSSGSNAGGQLNYQQSLYVSPNDENIIFSGGVRLWKSDDMGLNWTVIANSYHADNHGLYINESDHIYTATDGGVHVATDGGVVFNSLTDGIYGTEFIGDFGFSRKNAEVMIGGTIHNGVLGKYENEYTNWGFLPVVTYGMDT